MEPSGSYYHIDDCHLLCKLYRICQDFNLWSQCTNGLRMRLSNTV